MEDEIFLYKNIKINHIYPSAYTQLLLSIPFFHHSAGDISPRGFGLGTNSLAAQSFVSLELVKVINVLSPRANKKKSSALIQHFSHGLIYVFAQCPVF